MVEKESARKPGGKRGKGGSTGVRPSCDCETTSSFFIATFAPPSTARLRFRWKITVSSKSICDEGTPQNCEYTYTVETTVQRQRLRRGRPQGPWQDIVRRPPRKLFVKKFGVADGVNHEAAPDRIDQVSVTLSEWFPNAPKKESTEVSLAFSPSIRGGITIQKKKKIELCVPTGRTPRCPV